MYIPQGFNHLYGIPLIMEVGSLNTKIGFAGKDRPDLIAPSVPFNLPSMSRSIKLQVKRHSLTSTAPWQEKTQTLKVFWRVASSTIGKDSKHSATSLWGRNSLSILQNTLCSISSLLSVANNTGKNSLSCFFKSTNSMDFSCIKLQFCQHIFSDWKVPSL